MFKRYIRMLKEDAEQLSEEAAKLALQLIDAGATTVQFTMKNHYTNVSVIVKANQEEEEDGKKED